MPGYLTRDRILELFKRLNKKLQAREQTADLYIVGGAVMALAHDAKRVTEDVDSHIQQRTGCSEESRPRNRGRRARSKPGMVERGSDHAAPAGRAG